MTMEAGSSFQETMDIYARDNPNQALSGELNIILGEITIGKTLQEALEGFNQRITAQTAQNTIKALLQGQRMGTPLGKVLRDQAVDMRFIRSQSAEKSAEELKVRIQGPSMLMILAVFILILGPAFVGMMTSGMF